MLFLFNLAFEQETYNEIRVLKSHLNFNTKVLVSAMKVPAL